MENFAEKEVEKLKKDLRIFYGSKNIKKRVERIMSLCDPDSEEQRMPEGLVCLIDSLNNIAKEIKLYLSEEKYDFSEISKAVTPFNVFFKKEPKDEISKEEIEKIKQKIRGAKN